MSGAAHTLRVAVTDLRPLGLTAPVAPRLPTLERLLACASVRRGPADWREFLAGEPGAATPVPVAATIAAAAGLDPGPSWYLATPVQLVAGLSHVHLHPAGPLPLTEDMARALESAHARDFGDSGTRLVATRFGLLWQGAPGPGAVTQDPDRHTGQDAEPALPSGAGGSAVRRAMNELQMWLHESPLVAGAPVPPNALWLWGASDAPPWRPRTPIRADGDDAFLRALAHLAPPGAGAGRHVRALRVADLGAHGDAFAAAEARYFVPLAEDLRRGRCRRVELWFGGRIHALSRFSGWRYWRTPRPWWHGEEA